MNETPLKVDTGKDFALHGSLYLKPNAPSDAKLFAITFDFQGNGESGGSTTIGNLNDEVEDLRCVISYVRSTLKREVLGICGRSKGASVVLLYASMYNDVPLVINLSARYDYANSDYIEKFFPDKLEKLEKDGFVVLEDGPGDYIVRKEDLIVITKIDMSCVKNIIKEKVRVLTVHGSEDEICPVDGAYAYDKLIGPEPYHKLIIIEGANHGFKNHKDELLKAVESWLFENQSWYLGK
ncbi:33914_t:CDS:2 [Gigaspora margarita]|uniref:33914_t:CDS:1 n=1 Tax=Gigaspora margarita TaxID=4874 RepID=A0ABM8W6X1_GIGMA|nr:33914_t:CDS:2 [Gigaspora margarita]